MKQSKRRGNHYLAGLVIAFALAFFAVGTLGPAGHSPYYPAIVPLPALIALVLGWRAWSSRDERSTRFSGAALLLLVAVLLFSHLLPRSTG
jgi:hypothetical protein